MSIMEVDLSEPVVLQHDLTKKRLVGVHILQRGPTRTIAFEWEIPISNGTLVTEYIEAHPDKVASWSATTPFQNFVDAIKNAVNAGGIEEPGT